MIMDLVANFRNLLYDRGWLDQLHAPSLVLSIGNLTMGGTGKTPMVQLVVGELLKRSLRVAIVSRNYKARVQKFSKVDSSVGDGAAFFGDEPWLLASSLPGVDVFVTPRKFEAATLQNYDVILIDDGFQHRPLYRDADVVLIDVSRKISSLQTFPKGEAREPVRGLRRADAVILTKIERALPETIEEFVSLIRRNFAGPILHAEYVMELPPLSGLRVLCVSGIAHADHFESTIRAVALECRSLRYPDHHAYSDRDILEIESQGQEMDLVLTTEKDIWKIQDRVTLANLQAVKIRVEVREGLGALLDPWLERWRSQWTSEGPKMPSDPSSSNAGTSHALPR